MMRYIVCLAVALLLGASVQPQEKPVAKVNAVGGGYVHVVIFTLKKDAPADAVDDVIKDCHKMLGKISSVRSVKAGRPSKEVAEKVVKTDYDVGMVVLVDDFAGIKTYLEDPLHVKFVEKYGKYFEMKKLQVFDFVDAKK